MEVSRAVYLQRRGFCGVRCVPIPSPFLFVGSGNQWAKFECRLSRPWSVVHASTVVGVPMREDAGNSSAAPSRAAQMSGTAFLASHGRRPGEPRLTPCRKLFAGVQGPRQRTPRIYCRPSVFLVVFLRTDGREWQILVGILCASGRSVRRFKNHARLRSSRREGLATRRRTVRALGVQPQTRF